MRILLSKILPACLCFLLAACNQDKAGEVNTPPAAKPASNKPPVVATDSEVLRTPHVQLRLAGVQSSTGQANYSRNGAMLLGGDDASSVTYEIGLLREGDQLERLLLDLAPGRTGGNGCRLMLALAGSEAWQEHTLLPTDSPQELILKDSGLTAGGDSALFMRFECAAGQGIMIRNVTAEIKLSSGEAVLLEADTPRQDALNVDIRVPMRARDGDGRIATAFRGVATMYVTRGEAVIHIPINFIEGKGDTTFRLSEPGDYDVQFICDLQEPILTTLSVYETQLPVYEIKVQQTDYGRMDTIDFSSMPSHGSLIANSAAAIPVTVSGLPQMNDESSKRSLRLEFPQGWPDSEFGYTRQAMQLRQLEFDPTQTRELLANWVFAESGINLPRVRPVHLRVNGVFQGVYMDAELADVDWLDAQGYGPDSELYAIDGTGSLNPREDLAYFDELFLRVRQPAAGMQDLNDMLQRVTVALAEVPEEVRLEAMRPLMDTDAMFNYFLAMSLTSANDNYRNNYAVLHTGQEGGWSMLPTELSLNFGITGVNNPIIDPDGFAPINDMDMVGTIKENILLRALLNCPDSQLVLLEKMLGLMDGNLTEELVLARLDAIWTEIRADMLADSALATSEEQLEKGIEQIRENIRGHWDYMRSQILTEADEHAGHDH